MEVAIRGLVQYVLKSPLSEPLFIKILQQITIIQQNLLLQIEKIKETIKLQHITVYRGTRVCILIY